MTTVTHVWRLVIRYLSDTLHLVKRDVTLPHSPPLTFAGTSWAEGGRGNSGNAAQTLCNRPHCGKPLSSDHSFAREHLDWGLGWQNYRRVNPPPQMKRKRKKKKRKRTRLDVVVIPAPWMAGWLAGYIRYRFPTRCNSTVSARFWVCRVWSVRPGDCFGGGGVGGGGMCAQIWVVSLVESLHHEQ